MRILVTGGAGFIGSHLVDRLLADHHQVAVLDNLSTGRKENLNPEAKFYPGDIRDKQVSSLMAEEKPEVLFHLAAQINVRKSTEDPIFDNEVNVSGSLNLIKAFLATGGKKIIFASTGGVMYGETDILPTPETVEPFPLCPYGIAKLSVEKYLNYFHRYFNLSFAALRFGNVYGPRQNAFSEAGVVAIFSARLLAGKPAIIFGDGQQTRDFVYIDDVIRACLLTLEQDPASFFNVGTGEETSVNEIFSQVARWIDKPCERQYAPAKEGDIRRSCLATEKIKKYLGWQAQVSLAEGIRKTVQWFKEQALSGKL
ncbi:MAG: NAD-dependent epimerase/dehydratase family protein [Candidatus Omnitrophica bacterium]|nr:NAD-dependent epimerase/dehydratase family protein [Candidatus Omnitrophota bacterium]